MATKRIDPRAGVTKQGQDQQVRADVATASPGWLPRAPELDRIADLLPTVRDRLAFAIHVLGELDDAVRNVVGDKLLASWSAHDESMLEAVGADSDKIAIEASGRSADSVLSVDGWILPAPSNADAVQLFHVYAVAALMTSRFLAATLPEVERYSLADIMNGLVPPQPHTRWLVTDATRFAVECMELLGTMTFIAGRMDIAESTRRSEARKRRDAGAKGGAPAKTTPEGVYSHWRTYIATHGRSRNWPKVASRDLGVSMSTVRRALKKWGDTEEK